MLAFRGKPPSPRVNYEMNQSEMLDLRHKIKSFAESLSTTSGKDLFQLAFRLAQDAGYFVGVERPTNKQIGCTMLAFVATQSFAAATASLDEKDHDQLLSPFFKDTQLIALLKSFVVDWHMRTNQMVEIGWGMRGSPAHADVVTNGILKTLIDEMPDDMFVS